MAVVAFVATSYPSFAGDPAGHFVRAEAREALEAGDEVHVIAPAPFSERGITAHACGGAELFSWPGSIARVRERRARLLHAPAFAVRAVAALRTLRPERVVCHWLVPSAVPILWAAGIDAEREIVCHGADVRLLRALPSKLRLLIVRSALRDGSRVRFAAEDLRDQLTSALPLTLAGELRARSVVVRPSVSLDAIETVDERLPYVLGAGRLVAEKRYDVAIEAVARVADLRLILLGDGPDRARLERLATDRAPGRIDFHGQVERGIALGYLRSARALLHPSELDAAPTVVLEAMALGIPVLASEAGDLGRWAAGGEEITLLPRDPDAYARALTLLQGE
jgi:teichuronic acid biosynthesis glycosyltransferase TuaC